MPDISSNESEIRWLKLLNKGRFLPSNGQQDYELTIISRKGLVEKTNGWWNITNKGKELLSFVI